MADSTIYAKSSQSRATSTTRTPVDLMLFGVMLTLLVVGLWMVFNAKYATLIDKQLGSTEIAKVAANTKQMFYDPLEKQAFGVALGFCAFFASWIVGYRKMARLSLILMPLSILLLFLVLIPGVGDVKGGARAWLNFKVLSFQPSELAKLSLILYIAYQMTFVRPSKANKRKAKEETLPKNADYRFWLCIGAMSLFLLLIVAEKDTGYPIILFLSAMTTLALVGLRWRDWVVVCLVAAVLGAGVIAIFPHAQERVFAFVQPKKYPDTAYHANEATKAVRYGGMLGMGEGKERMKRTLPEADSDFIFAIYAQDTGLIGSLALLTAFGILTWRGVRITLQARDRLGQLVAGGVTALLTWQALINLGVATGSLPTTGVPLPFVSSGSTALVIFMACIGILLSVSQSGRLETQ